MKKDFLLILSAATIILILLAISLFNFGIPSKRSNRSLLGNDSASCTPLDLSGVFDPYDSVAYFEGRELSVPLLAGDDLNNNVLGVAHDERWVEVDLSDQMLTAWEGDRIFLQTAVSTGLPGTPTPTGEFRIWIKLRATKMEGGSGRYYYYLPNVPYVMYFGNDQVPNWKGYGLHGTYWHDDFGNPRSHGCVNLPTPVAERLYYWVSPVLPEGKTVVRSTTDNPGTRIVIHQ